MQWPNGTLNDGSSAENVIAVAAANDVAAVFGGSFRNIRNKLFLQPRNRTESVI